MIKGKEYQQRKRVESSIYTKSYLQKSEDMQTLSKVIVSDRFLPILEDSAIKGSSIEVHEMNTALAMDLTAAYLFSLRAGTDFLRNVSYRKHWLAIFNSTKPYWSTVAELFYPAKVLSKFGIHLIPLSVSASFKEIGDWCLSMCTAASIGRDSETPDSRAVGYDRMVDVLEKQDTKASSGHPRDLEMASEMLDHIFAGHETIAITLTYLMYELSCNPDLQSELHTELAALDPQLTYPPAQAVPSSRALDALPLLDAIINETLRRWPVVPGPQPRVTPDDSKPICGFSGIPGGVRISASAYSLHRNEEVFPEPEAFRPKRWLVEKAKRDEMFRWLFTFGAGARMCLGTHFAYQGMVEKGRWLGWVSTLTDCYGLLVMKLVVAAIYTNYTTNIVEMGDMEDADGFVGRPKGNRLVLSFKHV